MLSKETNETNLGHLHSLLFTFAANMKLSLINQINSSVGLHKKQKALVSKYMVFIVQYLILFLLISQKSSPTQPSDCETSIQ